MTKEEFEIKYGSLVFVCVASGLPKICGEVHSVIIDLSTGQLQKTKTQAGYKCVCNQHIENLSRIFEQFKHERVNRHCHQDYRDFHQLVYNTVFVKLEDLNEDYVKTLQVMIS